MPTVHGFARRHGETAYAFMALRFARPLDRDAVIAVLRTLGPLQPDLERVIDELPEELVRGVRCLGVPWQPPEVDELAAHRAVLEAVDELAAAWFFQTGTSLPDDEEDGDDDDDDDDEEDDDDGDGGDDDRDDDDDDSDGDPEDDEEGEQHVAWSHGPPQLAASVGFPVDGYPAVLDDLDWDDFGLAVKLAGPFAAGEETILRAFHALWLAPYGGRHRNAAVTIDRTHHAAHLWVDRFAVPVEVGVQVHHLLWIATQLDAVLPVVHARFAGATMAQKYGGLMGDASEPFVLGGNPLLAVPAAHIDAWIAKQHDWADEEIAQMLRDLAIEIAAQDDDEPGEADRDITAFAAELLAARARAGVLDPRALTALRPLAAERRGVIDVLGAARDRDSVPLLGALLGTALAARAADALGAIGDPSAIPALREHPGLHTAAALVACGARLDLVDELPLGEDSYLAYGELASSLPAPRREAALARLRAAPSTSLAHAAAIALAGGEPLPRARLHAALTEPGGDHQAPRAGAGLHAATVRGLRVALRVAELMPELVEPDDLAPLARFAEADLRGRAVPPGTVYARRDAMGLDDTALIAALAAPHVAGRAALIEEAGRRRLVAARPAIIAAASAVVARARPDGEGLLDPDARVLEAAVAVLRATPLDDASRALFERMRRRADDDDDDEGIN